MILFHGSTIIIEHPLVHVGRELRDYWQISNVHRIKRIIIGGITMRKDVLWRKIGRIIMMLSEELDISPARALNLFYNTETCKQLSDDRIELYLMSDKYIVDNIINEIRTWYFLRNCWFVIYTRMVIKNVVPLQCLIKADWNERK